MWWSSTRGEAKKSLTEWSYILRTHPNKTRVILKTLLEKGIATGEYLDNQNITIISRRMVRDCEISKIRREVGKLGGNPGLKKIKENLVNQNTNQKDQPSVSVSVTKKNKFIIPNVDDVILYCTERANSVNPQSFIDHYTANGWMVGKNKMKDWKAAVRTWESRNGNRQLAANSTQHTVKKQGRAESDGQPYPVDHEF